ncbi:hypothetical protein DKX38_007156 [Salix brachista]|uniref:TIR domain-containing protein n=1 Tax=Salix brachista TaxID=2182728 RepID=A0A5N5MMN4_9ROSI|nr:hypothetical protein DKX38_007156 [Salix brachista]
MFDVTIKLLRHERDCASEEVESWRHALKKIADLKGWDSSVIKDETKLIKKIVSDIKRKLSTSIDAKGLVLTLDLEERGGIDRLKDMCLIKIVQNEIWMHDVLLELGRKIVTQENDDPTERSRLWDAKEVYRVLTSQGTGKVESISLNLSETKEIKLNPAAFEGMDKLRLLKFYYPEEKKLLCEERVRILLPDEGLHFLSNELRILYWSHSPLKSLPSNFFPEKLVILQMPYSKLEQLCNDYQPLENLILMDLSYSSALILNDLDFCKVPKLDVVILKPHSIGELKSLVELNLRYCSKLASLPSSIGGLKSLVELQLSGCSELASLPESIGELKCLARLDLYLCVKLESLPNSIHDKLSSCSMLNMPHNHIIRSHISPQLANTACACQVSSSKRKIITSVSLHVKDASDAKESIVLAVLLSLSATVSREGGVEKDSC